MFVCCTPTYPLLTAPTRNFFWHFWKNIYFFFFFFAPFSSENHDFPIMQQCKKKNICKNKFFPTYLLNQKIQGRGTANKQFFKDGLSVCKIINFFRDSSDMCRLKAQTGTASAPLLCANSLPERLLPKTKQKKKRCLSKWRQTNGSDSWYLCYGVGCWFFCVDRQGSQNYRHNVKILKCWYNDNSALSGRFISDCHLKLYLSYVFWSLPKVILWSLTPSWRSFSLYYFIIWITKSNKNKSNTNITLVSATLKISAILYLARHGTYTVCRGSATSARQWPVSVEQSKWPKMLATSIWSFWWDCASFLCMHCSNTDFIMNLFTWSHIARVQQNGLSDYILET